MSSAYDLSLAPDSRFLKFREHYTSNEHLLSIYEGVQRSVAINDTVRQVASQRADAVGVQLDGLIWAVEEGFFAILDSLVDIRLAIENGFQTMYRLFDWGIARICWEHEQDRKVYRQMLGVLKRPLETQALEHRERAEFAIKNKLWEEAATELQEAISNNPYDYLAQSQLGQVMFFHFGQYDPALKHFQAAARYSDVTDASDTERYYAAVAYTHVAMLYRVGAETYPYSAQKTLQQAARASNRAVELHGDLPAAVQENVLDLLLVKDIEGARRAMETAVKRDENLLLGLEASPDLRALPTVSSFILDWRERHRDAVRETRRLIGETQQLVERLAPETWQSDFAEFQHLCDNLLADGMTPRQTIGAALERLRRQLLVSSEAIASAVDKQGTERERMKKQIGAASDRVLGLERLSERKKICLFGAEGRIMDVFGGFFLVLVVAIPIWYWAVELPHHKRSEDERLRGVACDLAKQEQALSRLEPELARAEEELRLLSEAQVQFSGARATILEACAVVELSFRENG